MDLSIFANLVNAVAVTAGVIFAATQIRDFRAQRHREAMLTLVRSFQSSAFTQSLRRVVSLPDSADTQKIRDALGPDGEDAVYLVLLTWESIGVLLYRREVSLDLIDDFFSGPILVSWRKLHVYVEEMRRARDRETVSEWFEWLVGEMVEREKRSPAVPAHIAHRRPWKQKR